jgi:hypothetical protein
MPSDEIRRLLKLFGVAATEFEDAVLRAAAPDEIKRTDGELRARLEEIESFIERLRRRATDAG